MEVSYKRWRGAFIGGGKQYEVEGSNQRWRDEGSDQRWKGAIRGEGKRSEDEWSNQRWR